MSQLPTTNDLANLGLQLANDGFTLHEDRVAQMTELARAAGAPAAVVAVLADQAASDTVRARAFAKLSVGWPTYRATLFDQQLSRLLLVWTAHNDLKKADPSTAALWESRAVLDEARLAVASHRPKAQPVSRS